jgi:uncharacterized membrane protein
MRRAFTHLFTPHWLAMRAFPKPVLNRIAQAVKRSEQQHSGEIRFAVEGPLHIAQLRVSPRLRAKQVFAQLGVWDTEENSGVLLYVQLVDRKIEIVADRGIAARVKQAEWDAVCRAMERAFKAGQFEAGALEAIDAVTAILARHFPPGKKNPNELPDKPAVL